MVRTPTNRDTLRVKSPTDLRRELSRQSSQESDGNSSLPLISRVQLLLDDAERVLGETLTHLSAKFGHGETATEITREPNEVQRFELTAEAVLNKAQQIADRVNELTAETVLSKAQQIADRVNELI